VGVELFLGGELVGEGEGEEEGVLLGPARLGVGLLVAEEAGEEAHDHTSTVSNATRSSPMRAKSAEKLERAVTWCAKAAARTRSARWTSSMRGSFSSRRPA